ncbi:ABC transporter permease [Sulfurimonas sp. HSL3-7]|uniref:ABC transporter permease n=1 Tax=Sulfonitrofixus jiaomeiensis TaxID=3131938 RepID=UPI0031F7C066
MKSFFAIVGKELLLFVRSYGLAAVVVLVFTADIYIAGNGIVIDAKNVSVGVVDRSEGVLSKKIITRLHQPEFKTPLFYRSQKELNRAIYNKEIMLGIIFASDFEKEYLKGRHPHIDVLLDSTAAAQSFMALSYLQNIIFDVNAIDIPLEIKTHKLFNQNTTNAYFMALTELLSVITLLSVILTAVVFVKEKESGTWDMMLLMPVNPKLTILAKSLSQVFIIMLGVMLSVGIVLFGAFDMPLNGSLWTFFLLTFFYAFTSAGIGLFVASVSQNTVQVGQFSIVIMMPLIFLSGAWTPVHAMQPFMQYLSLFSPLRYYIEGSESIFFRGTPFIDLLPYFAGVIGVGSLFFLLGFRKIGKLF